MKIINNCADPFYRAKLLDYYDRACQQGANHTPHIMAEALSWHRDYLDNGTMK
jgi:succinyl-CoA:acetate CoA-transferase